MQYQVNKLEVVSEIVIVVRQIAQEHALPAMRPCAPSRTDIQLIHCCSTRNLLLLLLRGMQTPKVSVSKSDVYISYCRTQDLACENGSLSTERRPRNKLQHHRSMQTTAHSTNLKQAQLHWNTSTCPWQGLMRYRTMTQGRSGQATGRTASSSASYIHFGGLQVLLSVDIPDWLSQAWICSRLPGRQAWDRRFRHLNLPAKPLSTPEHPEDSAPPIQLKDPLQRNEALQTVLDGR